MEEREADRALQLRVALDDDVGLLPPSAPTPLGARAAALRTRPSCAVASACSRDGLIRIVGAERARGDGRGARSSRAAAHRARWLGAAGGAATTRAGFACAAERHGPGPRERREAKRGEWPFLASSPVRQVEPTRDLGSFAPSWVRRASSRDMRPARWPGRRRRRRRRSRTPGAAAWWSKSGAPRVPSRPSASVRSDSYTRSRRGSSPSTRASTPGSPSSSGTSPRRRRSSWSFSIRERGRPTAERRAPPPGRRSAPRRPTPPSPANPPARAGRNRCRSGRPAGPNSSPAIRTRPAPIPRRHSSANAQRAASALSVSPISTCLASLVTRGVGQPGSLGRQRARSRRPRRGPTSPAARSRACTAASSSSIRAFGGSAHSGSRDQVDLAPVQPLRDDLGARRRGAPSSSTVAAAAASSAAFSSGVASRRVDQLEPVRVRRVDLGAAVDAEVEPPRARRPRPKLPVDVADVRARDHDQVEPGDAAAPRPARAARVASALRSGTAVPSQSKTTASNRRSSEGGSRGSTLRSGRCSWIVAVSRRPTRRRSTRATGAHPRDAQPSGFRSVTKSRQPLLNPAPFASNS